MVVGPEGRTKNYLVYPTKAAILRNTGIRRVGAAGATCRSIPPNPSYSRCKKTLLTIVLTVALWSGSAVAGVVEIDGYIVNDTVWTAGDTIFVPTGVHVLMDKQLDIEAGAVVMFGPDADLKISGYLSAVGEEDAPIVFAPRSDTVGGSPSAGDWKGLYVALGGGGLLSRCHVSHAKYGVRVWGASATIDRCSIENFGDYGIYLNRRGQVPYPEIAITDCIISQTDPGLVGTRTGLATEGSIVLTLTRTSIQGCVVGADFVGCEDGAVDFRISHCDILDNSYYGLQLRTST